MTYFVYTRKSKFTGKGESVENQKELCIAYIERNYPNDNEKQIKYFEDEGYSGSNLMRPHFQKMMMCVATQHVDYIVVYRLDRISRSVDDFSTLIEELTKKKIGFICIKEQFDTTTPMGRAMMYIASVFAQLERETIAERIRDNLYMLARTGRWLGGNTPLGFKSIREELVSINDKVRTACRLASVKEEQELVLLMYSMFGEKRSLSAVVRYLYDHNIQTRAGADFTLMTVRSILTNPVYCAADIDAYNYFRDLGSSLFFEESDCTTEFALMPFSRTYKENTKQIHNAPSEWILAIGKHKGLLSGKEWVRVQNILFEQGNKYKHGKRKSISSPALLSGLLVCEKCGSYMRPHMTSKRFDPEGKPVYYYICELKEKSHGTKCNMKNVTGNLVDKLVCSEIARFEEKDSQIGKSLNRLEKNLQTHNGANANHLDLLQNQLNERKGMIKNLILTVAKGGQEDDYLALIREQINELQQQCRKLEEELSIANDQNNVANSISSQIAMVYSTMKTLRDLLLTTDTMTQKSLLRSLIEKIIWNGRDIHIFLLGELL